MKKFQKSVVGLTATLITTSLMMTVPVMAAPSISSFIPDGANLIKGGSNIPENTSLTLSDLNTDNYTSTVKSGMEKFNDDDSVGSISDFLDDVDYTTSADDKVSTTDGKTLEVSNLDALIPLVDLSCTDGENNYYDLNGTIETSFKTEVAKGMTKDELVVMEVNPESGDVSFIEPTNYNPTNGEVTVKFDSLGSISLLKYSADDNAMAEAPEAETEATTEGTVAETTADTQATTTTADDSQDSPKTGDRSGLPLKLLLLSSTILGVTGAVSTKNKKHSK